MAFIYILENKYNNKKYVGQTTVKLNYRLSGHVADSRRYYYPICKVIKEIGIDSFNIYSFECDNCDLNYFERGFIRQLKTLYPNGYNMDDGGNTDKKRHLLTNKKISKPEKGKVMSLESRLKMSESQKKRVFTEEQKMNMSINNAKKKKIICVDTGEIFESITNASKKYSTSITNIVHVLKKEQKTAGGYKWRYA